MRNLLKRMAAIATVAGASLLLVGCYVGPGSSHHPRHCKKVETTKRVCVKSHKGHCKKWRHDSVIRWDC